MIASVTSATLLGARGYSVQVEVHVGRGLAGFSMLGLPDEACREALDRGREVMAVPGNLQVPSSSGTNALIRDGATPITSVDEVLRKFEVSRAEQNPPLTTPHRKGRAIEITHELSHGSLTLDQLVQRLSVPIGEVVVAVGELLRLEIIIESNGWLELSGSMLVSGKEHQ